MSIPKIPKNEEGLCQREIILRQRRFVNEMYHNEMWYEGERRGCWVDRDDPIIENRVHQIIANVGGNIRSIVVAEMRRADPSPFHVA